MSTLSGLARGAAWFAASLVLVPAIALAAPPEPVDGDAVPVEAAPVEPAPVDVDAPIEITPADLPVLVDPAPVEASVEAEPVEAEAEPIEEEAHGLTLPNPKIPPTGNTQMWFRSTTFFDYFGNNYNAFTNDDQFFALVNYVNFGTDSRLKKGWQLSTMMRVDTNNVFNAKPQALCDLDGDGVVTEFETGACRYGSDYRIERVQLRTGNKYFELTLGDFNVNFGRGIALSIRKIADIGVDATIKGGRLDINTKYLDLSGVAGVANRQQTDFATRTLFRDPGYPHALCDKTPELTRNEYGNPFWTMCSDIIYAGHAEAKLPGKVRVGGHYVFIWFGELLADQHEGVHMVGGDISRKQIAKHWDLFGGVTALMRNPQHKQYYPSLVENGIAAYLSNSLTFGNTFVLLEGKYYDNYIIAKSPSATVIQYAEAPTLERADQIIPAAGNTAGGRLLVEYTLPKSRVVIYGNYLGYAFATRNEQDMFARTGGEMAHHAYVGMRWRDQVKGNEIQASAGYRWEGFQSAPAPDILPYVRRVPMADFYVNQVVGKTRGMAHSVSLRAEWRYEEVQKGSNKQFHRGNIILGYGLSPVLTFAFIGGFSSEFAPLLNEPKLHPQPCDDENNCKRKPHLWPGAEVRINFLEASFLRVFAGRQVGGLLCVNGSCRTLPDFEGVRMDLVFSF